MGAAAGWYADGSGAHEYRYWNGNDWTAEVLDHGVLSSAPIASTLKQPTTPPAAAAPAPVPGVPKTKSPFYKQKRYYLVALVVVVIAGAVVVRDRDETPSAQSDVTVMRCSVDAKNDMHVSVKVTNHASSRRDYVIDIAFDSPDGKTQFDTAEVLVKDLAAGQSTNEESSTATTARGPYTCNVTDVNRSAGS